MAGQAKGLLLALEPAGEERGDSGASTRHTPAERPIRLGDW